MGDPSLLALQRWMKSRIRPGEAPQQMGGQALLLNPQGGSSGEERLRVYAQGYLVRMQQALAEVYDALQHVLGEPAFSALSRAYAVRHPSHGYNLTFMGRHLPEFLATYPLTQHLSFLPDLARLEWRVCQAFHAHQEPPLDPAHLASWTLEMWERAQVVFQPSVSLVVSDWPVLDIWQARTQPRETIDIELVNRPQRVLVFRQGLPRADTRGGQVRCELVDERQATLLDHLLAGRTFGAVYNELTGRFPQETTPVTDWFLRWTRAGLIVTLHSDAL